MMGIALKMLLADRAKYILLTSGVAFATFLMIQQTGVFIGIIGWMTSHLRNVNAEIWVVDSATEQVNELSPIREAEVNRVRSINGVASAVPLSIHTMPARLADGRFFPVFVIGLDNTTHFGVPNEILAGRIGDLSHANNVAVDQVGLEKLKPLGRELKVGDEFEINDVMCRVAVLVKGKRNFFGHPCVYAGLSHAQKLTPRDRRPLSAVLASVASGYHPEAVAQAISNGTGLKAMSKAQFERSTIRWFFANTGIPASFGVTIALGVIVGLAVCAQTFYSFATEHMSSFAALKCIGLKHATLARMLLVQANLVGFVGFGIGLGLTSAFGFAVSSTGQPPFELPWLVPFAALVAILTVTSLSALIAIRKLGQIDPVLVFRT